MASRGRTLTAAEAMELGRKYVAAYNDRDLEAMLALQDEDVVSSPTPLFDVRSHRGHEGVRAWWAEMAASGRWYDVRIRDIRVLPPDRVAVLGEICEQGESLSPWGVVVRVRDGLIIESRSYLSDEDLLDDLGLLQ